MTKTLSPKQPKMRPALRKAGRTLSHSGPFASRSQPCHFRRLCDLVPQRKSATHLAQGRSHFATPSQKKGRDPLCTGREAANTRKTCIKSWRKAGRTKSLPPRNLRGTWSYSECIWHQISLSNLAKSETLPGPSLGGVLAELTPPNFQPVFMCDYLKSWFS